MCLSDFSNEELVVLSSTLAIAISKDFSKEDFTDISMLHFSKKGSVANIIATIIDKSRFISI